MQNFRAFQLARVTGAVHDDAVFPIPAVLLTCIIFVHGLFFFLIRAKPRSVIETGSDRGVSTEVFLLTNARVVAVDPWEHQAYFDEFVERCGAYPHLEVCRGKCPDALGRFGAEFDLCYVDADHQYEFCPARHFRRAPRS